MGVVYISGNSDDTIVIEGDLEVEFVEFYNPNSGVSESHLAFSDGSVLFIRYNDQGIWRITPISIDRATDYIKEFEVTDDESENYSDLVRLSNPDGFKWVLKGSEWSNHRGARESSNFFVPGA